MLVPNGLDHQALDVRLLSSVPSPVADALLAKGCGRAADVLAQPQVLQEVLAQYRVGQPERRAGEMLRAVGREAAPTWRHATSALELLQQAKAGQGPGGAALHSFEPAAGQRLAHRSPGGLWPPGQWQDAVLPARGPRFPAGICRK